MWLLPCRVCGGDGLTPDAHVVVVAGPWVEYTTRS